MTTLQWRITLRFMFVVIYILNRYIKKSNPESGDLSWELESDLNEMINS